MRTAGSRTPGGTRSRRLRGARPALPERDRPGDRQVAVVAGWRQAALSVGMIMLALVTGGSVIVAVAALLYADRADGNQRQLLVESQLAGRFTAAVDQLGQEGPDKLQTRLGGVYTLERVMQASADDRRAVVEILAAFVRTHASDASAQASAPAGSAPASAPASRPGTLRQPAADVQAALTVLGRRPGPPLISVDIRGAYLPGADLVAANLNRSVLAGIDLTRASLVRANLTAANLVGADLTAGQLVRADLRRAGLARADLTQANLTQANLAGASLVRANLGGADLTGADLRGADLTDARGLRAAQLARATTDGTTRLPSSARAPSPTRTATPTAPVPASPPATPTPGVSPVPGTSTPRSGA